MGRQAITGTSVLNDMITARELRHALDVLGDPWTLQIIKEAYAGTNRFQDFFQHLAIPRQTLIVRLKRLCDHAVLYKRAVQHRRVVYEYHLTPKGMDLNAVALMIWRWHRHWHMDESILPPALYHCHCRASIIPQLVCGDCHQEIKVKDVAAERNPGYQHGSQSTLITRRPRMASELQKHRNYLATMVLGDCWSILVLNAVLAGACHFGSLQSALLISSNVLSARLKTLTDLGLLVTDPDIRDRRKVNYRASEKGCDVYPIIIALKQWGDRWLAGGDGPGVLLRHSCCGSILVGQLWCNHCSERLASGDVLPAPLVSIGGAR